jgi:hypothetical protein
MDRTEKPYLLSISIAKPKPEHKQILEELNRASNQSTLISTAAYLCSSQSCTLGRLYSTRFSLTTISSLLSRLGRSGRNLVMAKPLAGFGRISKTKEVREFNWDVIE